MAELEIFCAKWSTDLASDQTETLLNVKLQQLDKNWDSLLEAYEAIFMADAYPEVSESVEQKYAKCSESFQNCKAQMLEALHSQMKVFRLLGKHLSLAMRTQESWQTTSSKPFSICHPSM
ncbi:unnamed protein product [Ceratitis capitata]|uniref:(Mediterranean fruit fly) hypothetical protein n=1 Tax=Ceratitis capitata TaxID=7213 RepID=A0A811UT16_CERCA|nr:unnamed protein product [Ceratitis capitata]